MIEASVVSLTETTSWCARLKNAFGGVLLGLIFVFGSMYFLTWNEGNSVNAYNILMEGQNQVISLSSSTYVDPSNQGKLVHLTGYATNNYTLSDSDFGVISAHALHLKRDVQMFQWNEEETSETTQNTGGSATTKHTYQYTQLWSSTAIDSSKFKNPQGHQNPSHWIYSSQIWDSSPVKVNAFVLNPSQTSRLNNYMELKTASTSTIPTSNRYKNQTYLFDGGYYISYILSGKYSTHMIGDIKIKYYHVPPTDVTVVSGQIDSTFEPFYTKSGGIIDMISVGKFSAKYMFDKAIDDNILTTWLYRFIGFLVMWIGFYLTLQPVVIFADFFPFLGSFLGMSIGMLTFFTAAFLSLLIIAIAWMAYRPLLSALLLLVGFIIVTIAVKVLKRNRSDNNRNEQYQSVKQVVSL